MVETGMDFMRTRKLARRTLLTVAPFNSFVYFDTGL